MNTTAFVAKDSLGFGTMIDGALAEWIVEPVAMNLAEAPDEDGDTADFWGIDQGAAHDAITAAGYRVLGDFQHDGLDGYMVEVERA